MLASNLLVEHSPVGSGAYRSVSEWLEAIKMGRYTEIFMENGYSSMDAVAQVTLEDLRRLGVTLIGHQKKIMNSLQDMKVQLEFPAANKRARAVSEMMPH
ncbi:hypothetical protein IHE44_0013187 [Lamprotornis superbus]|uniref:SAM domain-containing protein n=1 Tax=Lamprotornis superbus TaxID=245042 RepID=A0A835TVM2_9PASS|nr:hypothetical protein IHE44_0013187 [Lamprotornis superbus]